jgi:hypothetical protein
MALYPTLSARLPRRAQRPTERCEPTNSSITFHRLSGAGAPAIGFRAFPPDIQPCGFRLSFIARTARPFGLPARLGLLFPSEPGGPSVPSFFGWLARALRLRRSSLPWRLPLATTSPSTAFQRPTGLAADPASLAPGSRENNGAGLPRSPFGCASQSRYVLSSPFQTPTGRIPEGLSYGNSLLTL